MIYRMTIFIGSILALAFMLVWNSAHGSSVCLTRHEARELWPRQHIYWYSSDHCWSNRRGPPSGIKTDLIRENRAESLPTPRDQNPAVTDVGKADRAVDPPTRRGTVPTTKPVRVIPITKWQNDFEDYCCWPPMEETVDIDREREHAFQLLAEKMKRQ